jgi:poly(A) polymerase
VFDARIGDISGRGKLAADMRDIWLMQPRLERRTGNGPFTLIEQPRFRAGFDFLRLRAEVGEIDAELGTWWEAFSLGSDAERERLMDAVKQADTKRRANAPTKTRASRDDEAESDASADGANDDNASEGLAADPVRKRRRRRRKPSEGRAATESADTAGGTTE